MKEKTFLALDRSIFEKFEGLSISLKEPEKLRKEPVLNPESPCSPDSFKRRYNGSVIFHDGLYRMWYIATDKEKKTAVAYAESIDGINWNKPELELVDYKGSKKNNLVSGLPGNTDCISVIKDDDGLFKAAVMNVHGLDKKYIKSELKKSWENKFPAFMGIATSIDGLSWKFKSNSNPAILEKLETCRLYKINNQYILNGQQIFPWAGTEWRGRVVTFFSSKDLKTWEKEKIIYRNAMSQCHVGIAPIKKAGDTIIGLVGRFHDAPELPDQHYDIGLVISHDGIKWTEPAPEQAFIRRGEFGGWDGGGVIQGQGIVEVNGVEHIFYSGSRIGNSPFSEIGIGYVSFPENRFGYAALEVKWDLNFKGERIGTLETKPMNLISRNGFKLTLNADNFEEGGFLKAAVLDEKGIPLKGYTFERCDAITNSGTDINVFWKETDIIKINSPFKLAIKFHGGTYRMQSPFLYSLKIKAISR